MVPVTYAALLPQQCVGHIPAFTPLKRDIEGHFATIKSGCSAEAGCLPRLSPELQSWCVCVCVCVCVCAP